MADEARFLIIDGYPKKSRDELQAGGASTACDLYAGLVGRYLPGSQCDVIFPGDGEITLPQGVGLDQYDGALWTGCNLTIFDLDDPRVVRQIELAKRLYAVGVPSYGSCWGVQMAVVAAGGTVRANPKGREMGIGRKITLTAEGRAHPMYEGKPAVFDHFESHDDEVTELPPGGVLLASNRFTRVQAVSVTHKRGTFWATQYHPEYDLHELARLTYCRLDKLTRLGFFQEREQGEVLVERMEALFREPGRFDLRWSLGIDDDVLSDEVRQLEFANWMRRLVVPSMKR